MDSPIHIVGIISLKLLYGLEYAQGCTQTEIGLIHHGQVTAEGNHASPGLHICCTKSSQLLSQHFLQTLHGLGDHLVSIHR